MIYKYSFLFVLFAASISICMTRAQASAHDGLLVTLTVDNQRVDVAVAEPDNVEYVLGFVSGQMASQFPEKLIEEVKGQFTASHHSQVSQARISKVYDCRNKRNCIAMTGTYWGRRPF